MVWSMFDFLTLQTQVLAEKVNSVVAPRFVNHHNNGLFTPMWQRDISFGGLGRTRWLNSASVSDS